MNKYLKTKIKMQKQKIQYDDKFVLINCGFWNFKINIKYYKNFIEKKKLFTM